MFGANFFPSFFDLESSQGNQALSSDILINSAVSVSLLTLLRSVIKGDASLNHLAMQLGSFQSKSMSRQAMHKRFTKASSAFLLGVYQRLIKEK